ncbi:hypothetical protein D0851_03455 [Marinobacter sp. Arc7-DN-1]|nr:hypothetical protein D0851_03455 [Marinobacter sp. Arc7-DN-1]
MGFSETRCEYVPVRSAPPSMAPQGFGKAHHTRRYVVRARSKNVATIAEKPPIINTMALKIRRAGTQMRRPDDCGLAAG